MKANIVTYNFEIYKILIIIKLMQITMQTHDIDSTLFEGCLDVIQCVPICL